MSKVRNIRHRQRLRYFRWQDKKQNGIFGLYKTPPSVSWAYLEAHFGSLRKGPVPR